MSFRSIVSRPKVAAAAFLIVIIIRETRKRQKHRKKDFPLSFVFNETMSDPIGTTKQKKSRKVSAPEKKTFFIKSWKLKLISKKFRRVPMIARTSDCPNFFVRKRGFLSFNLSRPAGNLVGKKDKAKLIEKALYTFPTKKLFLKTDRHKK